MSYRATLGHIISRLAILNALKPMTDLEKVRYTAHLNAIEVYSSNSIEGNTLTLDETIMIIEKDLVVAGKTFSEHLEAKNLMNAVTFAIKGVQEKKPLTEGAIKEIHKRISNGLLGDEIEGEYKKRGNRIGNIETTPPNAVQKEMHSLLDWYNSNKEKVNVVEIAAIFKYRFLCIHPFYDGNGRTSRVIVNYILGLSGYPPIIINPAIKADYYLALQKSTLKNQTPLIEFMAKCLLDSINNQISILSES